MFSVSKRNKELGKVIIYKKFPFLPIRPEKRSSSARKTMEQIKHFVSK